jgi:hypothetical protein
MSDTGVFNPLDKRNLAESAADVLLRGATLPLEGIGRFTGAGNHAIYHAGFLRTSAPIWDKFNDGFGNHAPGDGRYQQARSRWDAIHPGRPWAVRLQDRPENSALIITELKAYLRDWMQ